jgi:4'-phosphopantetheinyl transferase
MSKSILKIILSNYMDIDVYDIDFVFNKYGKPSLSTSLKNNYINFNISHSEDIGVFAFSTHEVGVDVEKIKPIDNIEDVIELCFTDFEKQWYNRIDKKFQMDTFFKIWTIKEAFIKAIGKGLSFSPLNIELTNEFGNQIKINKINSEDYLNKNFHVKTFSILHGFITSIVYEGQKQINIFNWKFESNS